MTEEVVIDPKVGDIVSVWFRDSPKRKWECEKGLVRIVAINGNRYCVQTSLASKDGQASVSEFAVNGWGEWERQLRQPLQAQPSIHW